MITPADSSFSPALRSEVDRAEQQKWYSEHVRSFENLWTTWPYIAMPPASFPRLTMIAEYRTSDRRYFSSGAMRQNEDHCLFQYTLAGSGYFRGAAGEMEVGVGQGFLCQINDVETSYYYGDRTGSPWHFLAICLEGEAAQSMVRELLNANGPIFTLPLNAPLWHQLQGFRGGDYSVPHMPLTTVVELASLLLLALWQSTGQAQEEPADLLMKKAMHRLSLPTPLPEVSDLAESLHVSREHFSRVFRSHMGVSPQHWINQERISRACRLLCTTELSNKQLAYELGYEQPSSFLRAFRRATSLSPRQFRHKAQENSLKTQSP